jgi:hypothetical protein
VNRNWQIRSCVLKIQALSMRRLFSVCSRANWRRSNGYCRAIRSGMRKHRMQTTRCICWR